MKKFAQRILRKDELKQLPQDNHKSIRFLATRYGDSNLVLDFLLKKLHLKQHNLAIGYIGKTYQLIT